jgi:hypothetical protein
MTTAPVLFVVDDDPCKRKLYTDSPFCHHKATKAPSILSLTGVPCSLEDYSAWPPI